MPPPPPPAAPPADFQKKLDDLKAQLASAEKNHASQMKDAESKLSNLQGNSSKEMETLRLQFAKDMEALRKAMEEVHIVFLTGKLIDSLIINSRQAHTILKLLRNR